MPPDAPIGANVPTDDFDVTRLTDDVAFSGNGTNLDSASRAPRGHCQHRSTRPISAIPPASGSEPSRSSGQARAETPK
ncbi:MAG: hypothetical protein DRJ42_07415 [Deltaproteobacteria bacterium]|nr:MAG: hypothetical protein DRJ42_07415 [Deltaproteobacteria bacterium]